MPPKAKFTRDQVAVAALDIVREDGIVALTARNLGAKLGMSSRPIFTAFRSMDEVKLAARELALEEFKKYAESYHLTSPDIIQLCMLVISYAVQHLELFRLLFMQDSPNGESPSETLERLGEISEFCIAHISREEGVTHAEACTIFEQLCIYAFGIGALYAMKLRKYDEPKCRADMESVYRGLVLVCQSEPLIKQGKE